MIPKNRIEPGTVFGRLTVIGPAASLAVGKGPTMKRRSLCKCECGKEVIVLDSQLRNGKTQSCGCYRYDQLRKSNTTHGESKTKLYDIRLHMMDRCTNPKCKEYHSYGGRGISVCREWEDSWESFRDWALSNGYKDGLQIDRVDNNGNYCPENCRFVTRSVNCNNKRTNHLITWKGETHTMKEWSDITGIAYTRIRYRAEHNWDPEQIFENRRFNCGNTRKRVLGLCKTNRIQTKEAARLKRLEKLRAEQMSVF